MIDTKYYLRKAYWQALNGSITYGGNSVPFYDDVAYLGSNDSVYVLMTQNTSQDQNTQQTFGTLEDFTLDIVQTGTRVNKAVLDNVAAQIFNIVCPNTQQNGLSPQPGISIIDVYKSSDDYQYYSLQNAKSVVRRRVVFTQLVTQGDSGQIIPIPAGGSVMGGALFKYTSADFSNTTDVIDPILNGYNITVFLNDSNLFLNDDPADGPLTFETLAGGGFRVLLPGFDKNDANYTFYVAILSN